MSDIMFGLLLIGLIGLSALCAGIINGMFALNKYQLKRKAQLGSHDAKIVYPIHALRYQLLVTLLFINVASNATITILLSSKTSNILAVLFSTLFILVFGEIIPMIYLRKYVVYMTARIAPVLNKILSVMTPISKPIARIMDKWVGNEAQIFYSKEELLKMFDGQKLAKDSGIARDEARMLRSVLEFGDKQIREVMTPRRMVKFVQQNDLVGPVLVDYLHSSGHSRFPVKSDDKHFNFVGTLYLRDLVRNLKANKIVKDLMDTSVLYIHEEESLDYALRMFLKTHHHLFVVVNNFEEFVGVLSIEDVLEEIIGKEIVDEFDQHDDLRKVAKSLASQERHTVEQKAIKSTKTPKK